MYRHRLGESNGGSRFNAQVDKRTHKAVRIAGVRRTQTLPLRQLHLGPRIMGKCDLASMRKDAVNSWS